jgi:hypothetical protein
LYTPTAPSGGPVLGLIMAVMSGNYNKQIHIRNNCHMY